jgi:putative thiamine transport system permease protein
MLRLAPALLLTLMLGPLAAGLGITLAAASGLLPLPGGAAPALAPARALLAMPGLAHAVALTLWTGGAATLLALAVSLGIAVLARHPKVARAAGGLLPPLLATPPLALAAGFAFLIAPSGWIARLISPWLTGWHVPPDVATVQDPLGIALILGLALKEAPYLLLMCLAGLAQIAPGAALAQAASLGYGPWRGFAFAVLPRLWPLLRLPVLAVLAYAFSVVDVALLLGPSDPPTLAVLVFRAATAPDLAQWYPAAAGAALLGCVMLAAMALLRAAERLAAGAGRWLLWRGFRGGDGRLADAAALAGGGAAAGAGGAALLALLLWSFAVVWHFPAALPGSWGLAAWRMADLARPALTTLWLGLAATALALALSAACLENERRRGAPPARAMALLYLPLLLPQLAVMFGVQLLLVALRMDGTAAALVWAHLVFVLPYVFLALAEPWRALDPRYARAAACLGAPPWRVFLRVTLPLLARPLAAAAAVGFAVSAGLYLPSLFAGGGRVDTLATVTVALAGGGDRRALAAAALAQAALPLAAYALALLAPARRA